MIKGHSVSMYESLRRASKWEIVYNRCRSSSHLSNRGPAPIITQPAQSFFSLFKPKLVRDRAWIIRQEKASVRTNIHPQS